MYNPIRSSDQRECSTPFGPEEREPEVVEAKLTPVRDEEDSFQRNIGNSKTPHLHQIDEQVDGPAEEFTQDERVGDKSTDTINSVTPIPDSDVGNWQIPVPDGLRVEIIKRGSECFQKKDGPFETVQRAGDDRKGQTRQLTLNWFYKHLPNDEKVLRKWMVYFAFVVDFLISTTKHLAYPSSYHRIPTLVEAKPLVVSA